MTRSQPGEHLLSSQRKAQGKGPKASMSKARQQRERMVQPTWKMFAIGCCVKSDIKPFLFQSRIQFCRDICITTVIQCKLSA